MAATAATAKKKAGWGKWKAFGVVAVATFLAVETGWAGFGWAKLRSAVYPNDTALLGWVPGDAGAIAVIDPHQLDREALGAEGSTTRTALERTRDDVKKVTGIDLAFDVDKLIVTPSLVVARGRFDGKKLADKLGESHYVLAEHKGETYLVRSGEDAIAAIGGSILLYGDEAGVKAAIDAQKDDTSLEKNEPVKARLAQVGWNHPVLVTVRITDEKPSVRALLTGATGPRAVTVGVSTLAGLDLDAVVETPSPSAGTELAKLLDEKRQALTMGETPKPPPQALATPPGPSAASPPALGAEVTPILAEVAKKATIAADPQTGAVRAHAHLDEKQIDTLAKNARAAVPFAEVYKSFRLFQLLAPGG